MTKRLEGKVAIVTGATSGIGKAIAVLFAKQGAKVVFSGRRESQGKEIEEEIAKEGGVATFVQTNVNKQSDLKNLVNKTIALYGQIDILVNNAGIMRKFDFVEMDEQKHFDDLFNTNVKSYFMLSKEVLPHMLEKKCGSIVNTASVGGEIGMANYVSYSSTKGAVKMFTKSLAVEYAKNGIRVNAILPGLTNTGMVPTGGEFESAVGPAVPMGRSARPEEIANGALFLASDEASYCTGSFLIIDGGLTSI